MPLADPRKILPSEPRSSSIRGKTHNGEVLPSPTFTTELRQSGGNLAVSIPAAVVAEVGGSRVPVVLTLNGIYNYRDTIAVMGELNLVGLSAIHHAGDGCGGLGDPGVAFLPPPRGVCPLHLRSEG